MEKSSNREIISERKKNKKTWWCYLCAVHSTPVGSFCLCVYSYITLRDFPTRLFIFFLNSFPPLLWKKVGGFFLRFLAIKEEEEEDWLQRERLVCVAPVETLRSSPLQLCLFFFFLSDQREEKFSFGWRVRKNKKKGGRERTNPSSWATQRYDEKASGVQLICQLRVAEGKWAAGGRYQSIRPARKTTTRNTERNKRKENQRNPRIAFQKKKETSDRPVPAALSVGVVSGIFDYNRCPVLLLMCQRCIVVSPPSRIETLAITGLEAILFPPSFLTAVLVRLKVRESQPECRERRA